MLLQSFVLALNLSRRQCNRWCNNLFPCSNSTFIFRHVLQCSALVGKQTGHGLGLRMSQRSNATTRSRPENVIQDRVCILQWRTLETHAYTNLDRKWRRCCSRIFGEGSRYNIHGGRCQSFKDAKQETIRHIEQKDRAAGFDNGRCRLHVSGQSKHASSQAFVHSFRVATKDKARTWHGWPGNFFSEVDRESLSRLHRQPEDRLFP